MPVWVWVLLALSAVGGGLFLLERQGVEVTERYGRILAVFFILALLGGLYLAFVDGDWN